MNRIGFLRVPIKGHYEGSTIGFYKSPKALKTLKTLKALNKPKALRP